jgi:arabinofuranan 3-O-arabinosyltransferase
VQLEDIGSGVGSGFSIAELTIPGVRPTARLDVPIGQAKAPDRIVLRSQYPGRGGCLFVGERPLCTARFTQAPEEAVGLFRSFTLPEPRDYQWSGTVVPTTTTGAERLLVRPGSIEVGASSRRTQGLEQRPASMVDADLGTGWVADPSDATPQIVLTLPERRRLSGLQFLTDRALAGSRPTRVGVSLDRGRGQLATVDGQGYVRFPETMARTMRIRILATSEVVNVDVETGFRSILPAGISELRVLGADDLRRPIDKTARVEVPCGFGPSLEVDGHTYQTRVTGSVRDILRGQSLRWSDCGTGTDTVDLAAGRHEVSGRASAEFVPDNITLTSSDSGLEGTSGESSANPSSAVTVRGDRLMVPGRDQPGLVVVAHTFNEGWRAQMDGRGLQALRVNGWQQGWLVPAGQQASVTTTFAPGGAYRRGLAGGAVVCVLLLGALGVARRGIRTVSASPPTRMAWPLVVAVGALLANSGWAGVVGGFVGVAIAVVARGRGVPTATMVALLGMASGMAVAIEPWSAGRAQTTSAPVQGAVIAAFACACVAGWSSLRRPQRMIGFSTKRKLNQAATTDADTVSSHSSQN